MKKILFLACLPVVALYSCCGNGDKTQETFGKVFKEVKAEYAPDSRSKTFDLSIEKVGQDYVLRGSTNQPEAKAALEKALADAGVKALDSIKMLPDAALEGKIYGVSTQSVINFRTSGKYSAESATQVMMGTPLQVLE